MSSDLPSTGMPTSSIDLYGRSAIQQPHLAYRELLAAGPLVRLSRHDVLAVGRYRALRSLLKADEDFVSSQGVTMNPLLNRMSPKSDTVLVTDGEKHARLRRVLMEPMRPRALEAIKHRISKNAREKVDSLVGQGRFEGMTELASHLPVTIVAELVGLPAAERAKMVSWSKATFNTIGPVNLRSIRSVPAVASMFRFQRTLKSEQVEPGTWVHRLFQLRDAGEIRHTEAIGMVLDYIAPSLDTTIFATGHLLNRLGRHPDQWEALQADPSLVLDAVNESLRIDSVVRAFTRVAARDIEFEGRTIRAGQRILCVYGAANRDERHYPDPDTFDITRNARDHMAFGHGAHACAGTRLARLEMEALLESLLERIDRIIVGDPKISNNNTLHGFDALPLELVPR
jgi:cytochrome P450